MRSSLKKIIIADYYGFCMGVRRAISISEEAAAARGPVTIYKEIVHNEAIVEKFRAEGVGQTTDIDSVDDGTLIIPAHGASPDIMQKADKRGLQVINATCPLVIRIHKIIKKLAESGYRIIHFGDSAHDETIGIVGHAPRRVTVIADTSDLDRIPGETDKIALTSQTTASVADFSDIEKAARKKFPHIEVFNTICNATEQRQAAVMKLAPEVDLMLVVGSKTSANSNRLYQISRSICGLAHMINSPADIRPEWFVNRDYRVATVGLTAGASTPDFLITGAIKRLQEIAGTAVEVVPSEKKQDHNRLALKNTPPEC